LTVQVSEKYTMQIQGLDCVQASTPQLISSPFQESQVIGHRIVHHTQSQFHSDEQQQVLAQISILYNQNKGGSKIELQV
jgi:hypothetical protein